MTLSGRWLYAALTLGVAAFAIYGSLIPFRLEMRPLDEAWATFRFYVGITPRRVPRADFVANILLFVPFGFSLMGTLVDGRRRRAALAATVPVLIASIALSVLAEFLQVFTPGRTPSRLDIVAQTIGCAIGIAGWILAGPAITAWIRDTAGSRGSDRLSRLLFAYVVAWAFVSLAPFNFTYDLGELGRRVRDGRISLVPFGAYDEPGFTLFWDIFITAVAAIPLGAFGLFGLLPRSARRGAGAAFALGAAIIVAVELIQIFIRAHAADSGDVLAGWAGVGIGVFAGCRLLRREVSALSLASSPSLPWIAAGLVMWAAVIAAYHWAPFTFTTDPDAIRGSLRRVSLVPFAGYYSGSALNALNNLLTKLGLAAPIGVLSSFILRRQGGLPVRLAWLGAVVVLFAGIEAGQIFVRTRVPDPTDVGVGVVGSTAGLLIGWWARSTSRRSPSHLPD